MISPTYLMNRTLKNSRNKDYWPCWWWNYRRKSIDGRLLRMNCLRWSMMLLWWLSNLFWMNSFRSFSRSRLDKFHEIINKSIFSISILTFHKITKNYTFIILKKYYFALQLSYKKEYEKIMSMINSKRVFQIFYVRS